MKYNQNKSITNLHGNSIIKRTVVTTPQDDGSIIKAIETFFNSGKLVKE